MITVMDLPILILTPVELPVYHVRDARDYIRWWLDGKQGRLPGTREVVKVDTYL